MAEIPLATALEQVLAVLHDHIGAIRQKLAVRRAT